LVGDQAVVGRAWPGTRQRAGSVPLVRGANHLLAACVRPPAAPPGSAHGTPRGVPPPGLRRDLPEVRGDLNSFFPNALSLIRRPGGFPRVIAFFLSTPQFQEALRNRPLPPAPNQATPPSSQPPTFTVGTPFINPYAVNRQSLVPDPVTDPAAWNDTPGTAPVPMQSPWGKAVVLPEVPYGTLATGQAVQPTLTLPSNLISASNLSDGITFQTWFQAKNPGALLTAELTQSGSSARYQAPLVYVDYSGKLVAGLFDSTPLTVQQLQGQN